jgi:hypothetical protein
MRRLQRGVPADERVELSVRNIGRVAIMVQLVVTRDLRRQEGEFGGGIGGGWVHPACYETRRAMFKPEGAKSAFLNA